MWLTPYPTTLPNNNAYTHTTQYSTSQFPQTSTTTACSSHTNDTDPLLDVDSEIRSQASTSSSSSPQSTSGTFPLSTFDSLPTSRNNIQSLTAANMKTIDGTWPMVAVDNPFVPKMNGRSSHNRDSSLSSMGSYGPASPFTFNAANPQIALNDTSDHFQTLQLPEEQFYQLSAAKAPNSWTHDSFYSNFPSGLPSGHDSSATHACANMTAPQKHRGERSGGLLPPPDFPSGASSHSRPGSVASSVASDSPATPAAPEPQEDKRRKTNGENFLLTDLDRHDDAQDKNSSLTHHAGVPAVPKLARTMTDIYGDELYLPPNYNMVSAPPSQPSHTHVSPTSELFVQRVQAANDQHMNQHLSANMQTPMSSATPRGRSPFRQGSPLAPALSHDLDDSTKTRLEQERKWRKAQADSFQALRQPMAQSTSSGTPQTISPKDAVLEFNDSDSNNFPLFPQTQPSAFDTTQPPKMANQANNLNCLTIDTNFDQYLNSPAEQSMSLAQQYPFVSKPRSQASLPSASNLSFSLPSRTGTSPSLSSDTSLSTSPRRPEHVGAEGGTYTCTYHGCTQRFETPALLQKHKREGHRQAHGLNTLRRPEGPTGSYFNTQAGPHKCERINPSTGKPCNTIFSRPYDLTRHEDTIHNGKKQKVRCDVCTEEKTFSRADALTRHYRVCHPDLEFPGKHRKRGGAIN